MNGAKTIDESTANGGSSGWILTYCGVKFYPLDPRAEDVRVEDIAHALSNICRFTGHTTQFYSVAEHCVRASRLVGGDRWAKLYTILHDASEAYLCDVARPIKPHLAGYRELEEKLQHVIHQALMPVGAPPARDYHHLVKHVDTVMLCTEGQQLTTTKCKGWDFHTEEWALTDYKIAPWSPTQAKGWFLREYWDLVNPPEVWD